MHRGGQIQSRVAAKNLAFLKLARDSKIALRIFPGNFE
jgi:hypothetical protein